MIKGGIGLFLKKIIKPLKITFLILTILIAIAILFAVPSFSASSKDIVILRLSTFCFFVIGFVLPTIIILSPSIRRKIPLFKNEKLISAILGWSLLFVIGMIVYGGINTFHSKEYNVAKAKYDAQIEAKRINSNKLKEEAKAQAKAKKEAEAKAREDAKAKKIADSKKVAENKAKADAEAKANAEAKAREDAKAKEIADTKKVAESKAKVEAYAKTKSDAEIQAKARADAKAKEENEIKSNQGDIDKITKATSLTSAESLKVVKILKSVGITSIDSIANKIDLGKGSIGYSVNDNFVLILINNRVANISIVGRGITLYDGGVKGQAKDYTISDSEAIEYAQYSEECVKSVLKAPSTAKFAGYVLHLSEYPMIKNKNIVQVSSYVDSQNSFGAMLRDNYIMQINLTTNKCSYLQLGNKRLYGTYKKIQ